MKIIDIDIKTIEENLPEQLQRTKNWYEQRRGLITGSAVKELMAVERSESKMEWGRPEKMISFGVTAKKYIFEKAKEIQRKKVVKTPTSSAMKYGTNNEYIVFQMLQDQYKEMFEFEKCDFIKVPNFENILGASPDGKITRIDNGEKLGLEIKCVTGWDGLYDRHEETIDQSHKDFWQLQTEMLALGVNQIMYVVAEPSEDIFEPNTTDLSVKFVYASPIHQLCIIKRSLLAEQAIKEWFEFNGNLTISDCLLKVGTNFDYEKEYNNIINGFNL